MLLTRFSAAQTWQLYDSGTGNVVLEVDPVNLRINMTAGLQTESVANALTAFSGGGQGSATLLTAMINRVTTVAVAGDSVKLPASIPGLVIIVVNAAGNSMNVFPQTGDQIDTGGVNGAYAIAGGKTVSFSCAVAGQWHGIKSA